MKFKHVLVIRCVFGVQKQKHCLRHTEYNETRGYVAKNLPPGNHSYRVRATSLAGPGPWTDYKYFIVHDIGWCHSRVLYRDRSLTGVIVLDV